MGGMNGQQGQQPRVVMVDAQATCNQTAGELVRQLGLSGAVVIAFRDPKTAPGPVVIGDQGFLTFGLVGGKGSTVLDGLSAVQQVAQEMVRALRKQSSASPSDGSGLKIADA